MNLNTPTSIFDSNFDPKSFVFTPPKLLHRIHLALEPLTTSSATCKNLNNGTTYQGLFKLQGHLIAYYKNQQKTVPEQVLDILYARVKSIQKNEKYAIQITRNMTTFELCFDNQETADSWLEYFKDICVFASIEDRYMPLRFFDQYPFSSTYVAKSKENKEIYAIKRFNKKQLIESNSNARLFDQITMMRNLTHPNLTPLYEVSETSTAVYFVKQYNPYETLEYILTRSNLQFSDFEFQTAKIAQSIFEALAFLASEGATVRSLNLHNVVIDKEGQVKITDFYFVTKSNQVDFIDDQILYPGYIAPEIFRYNRKIPSTAYDEKCNVFSAGCILFELLFGFPLFFDQDFGQSLYLNKVFNYNIAAQFINEEINDSTSAIPKQGLKLLLKLLEPDYTQRISAEQALSHPYFNILSDNESSQKTNKIFLNLINQARSDVNLSPSSFSCSIADITHELSSEAVEKLYAALPEKVEEKNLKESLLNLKKRRVHHAVTKDTDGASSRDLQYKKGITDACSYNASIVEDILSISPKGKTFEDFCFEDNGELSDSDDETNSSFIESFLGNHKLQVSIRGPGL